MKFLLHVGSLVFDTTIVLFTIIGWIWILSEVIY